MSVFLLYTVKNYCSEPEPYSEPVSSTCICRDSVCKIAAVHLVAVRHQYGLLDLIIPG